MKKSTIIIIAIFVLMVSLVTGTFANYTATRTGVVSLTGYKYDMEVNGKSDGDLDIAPGQEKSGTFTVENTGSGAIKVSEISVTTNNTNLSVSSEPSPTDSSIVSGGGEDYTFSVKLDNDANEDQDYEVTITVTVIDDLGNESTIDMTDVSFE